MTKYLGWFVATLFVAVTAAAQDRPVVSLTAENPARWDAAGHVGWRGVDKSGIAPDWNRWYDVGTFGATVGHYVTPNVKLELDLTTTTSANVFVQQPPPLLSATPPGLLVRVGEQRFRLTTLSGAVVYQFFENTWSHPFIGAGVEVLRESSHVELREQRPCPPLPCGQTPLPSRDTVSHRAQPFAIGGFKWYVNEHAFIRSDLRTVFSSSKVVDAVQWRIGIGADF